MRAENASSIGLVVLAMAGVIAGTAILTPVAWWGASKLFGGEVFPFSRIFDRIFLVLLLGMLWVARRRLVADVMATSWQRDSFLSRGADVAVGIIIAIVPCLIALDVLQAQGILVARPRTASYYVLKAMVVIPGVAIVAILEELIFRVWLLDLLRSRRGALVAVLGSSVIFALVHVLAPASRFRSSGYEPLAGFHYLGAMGSQAVIPGFGTVVAGLLVVGILLAVARVWLRSLFLAIGMHTGWILAAKCATYSTMIAPEWYLPNVLYERYFVLMQAPVLMALVMSGVILFVLGRREAT